MFKQWRLVEMGGNCWQQACKRSGLDAGAACSGNAGLGGILCVVKMDDEREDIWRWIATDLLTFPCATPARGRELGEQIYRKT